MADGEEYSSDETKRKRNEGVWENVFSKSKRTARSPEKTSKNDDKIEKMMNMMQTMNQTLANLTTEMKEMRKEQREYKEEVKELRKENQKMKEKNEQLQCRNIDLDDRLRRLENEKRRNNIIIQGIKIDADDKKVLKEASENVVERYLGIKVNVKMAAKLGEKTYLVQMQSEKDKDMVMKNKHKLRNVKNERIYMNNDLSKTDREVQNKIREKLNEIKKTGKQVKMGYRKMWVETEEWKWDNQKEMLVEGKNKFDLQKN